MANEIFITLIGGALGGAGLAELVRRLVPSKDKKQDDATAIRQDLIQDNRLSRLEYRELIREHAQLIRDKAQLEGHIESYKDSEGRLTQAYENLQKRYQIALVELARRSAMPALVEQELDER